MNSLRGKDRVSKRVLQLFDVAPQTLSERTHEIEEDEEVVDEVQERLPSSRLTLVWLPSPLFLVINIKLKDLRARYSHKSA
jgi:hypothetical protein